MDFAKRQPNIDADATVWTDVKINGIKSGLRLQVRSADHPELKRVAHKVSGRMIRQGVIMRGLTEDQQDELLGRSQDDAVREQAVAVTTGWEWGEDEAGDPFTYAGEVWDYSDANVRKLFEILPEAVDAANVAASKTANFMPKSAKPSRKPSAAKSDTGRQTARAKPAGNATPASA